jgi:hypothetical protein
MSKEKSIPKRLSGTEALDSIMDGIYKRLCAHGHFHSHKAYQGYSATVKIDFRPARSFSPPLTDEFSVGDLPFHNEGEIDMEFLPSVTETIDIPVRPPNQVREEAGLDMPVQVEEQGQLVERFIPPAKYKGRLKGQPRLSTANMTSPAVPGINPVDDDSVEQFGIQTR